VSHSNFSQRLLIWYQKNARVLPWRGDRDPYAVWISEIMLQQTQVDTVIPYYYRWMEQFPTVKALSQASQQQVLSLWEGLGYYGRARNLQRASQIIMTDWNGEIPHEPHKLINLPGVGLYTAGAIASIAFNQDVPVLDGNVRRVFARLFDVEVPARSPAGEKLLWKLAAEHLPPGNAASYNQALMDLGALICTPAQPKCSDCPLKECCLAFAKNLQQERPVQIKRARVPHYIVTAAVIFRQPLVLIAQRPDNSLLGGLWEFPGGKQNPDENLEVCLKREIREELGAEIEVGAKLGIYRHAYTHFRITLHAFCCGLQNGAHPTPLQVQDLRWVEPKDLTSFPMGKTDRLIARDLQAQGGICSS
jgi:A/G-specific adenine glycosylase